MNGQNVYTLNARLVDWAYNFTKDISLADDATLQRVRAPYTQPMAKQPRFVLEGDGLASSTFWVGDLLNIWAEKWVSYWTKGRGTFATSLEEDAGIMQAITSSARRTGPTPRAS